MLQLSTLLFQKPCRLSVENLRLRAKLIWKENKDVCFDIKLADFRLWHTNSSIFQHPAIESQEYVSNC